MSELVPADEALVQDQAVGVKIAAPEVGNGERRLIGPWCSVP